MSSRCSWATPNMTQCKYAIGPYTTEIHEIVRPLQMVPKEPAPISAHVHTKEKIFRARAEMKHKRAFDKRAETDVGVSRCRMWTADKSLRSASPSAHIHFWLWNFKFMDCWSGRVISLTSFLLSWQRWDTNPALLSHISCSQFPPRKTHLTFLD